MLIEREKKKPFYFEITEKDNSTKRWLKAGLSFGLSMFVAMVIALPLIKGEDISQRSILIGIPIWLIGGLGWGFFMKKYTNKMGKENKAHNNL